jgi:hypothetical protein
MANLARMAGFLWKEAPGLWGAAALGVPLVFWERSLGRWRAFVLGFAAFSFLAVSLDGHFRGHYFLLLLPAAGLLAGAAVHATTQLLARYRLPCAPATIPLLALAIAGITSLLPSRGVFFVLSPANTSSDLYGVCPFPEAVDIGAYLATNCPPAARIAVLGSEPEIYFYSHRRSATGYLYTYPLMDPGSAALAMQQEMIREVEKTNPDYLVSVQVDSSWMQTPDSNTLIFEWLDAYSKAHFDLVALVEMLSNDRADYTWSAPKGPVSPRSNTWLAVYKRKPAADADPTAQ